MFQEVIILNCPIPVFLKSNPNFIFSLTSSSGGGSYSTEPVDKMSGGGGMNNGMNGGMNSMDSMRNSPGMDGSGQVGSLKYLIPLCPYFV